MNICKAKKSNANSLLQNLNQPLLQAATLNSLGMTERATHWRCRTLPPGYKSTSFRVLELSSAQRFCCFILSAWNSHECSDPSFPNRLKSSHFWLVTISSHSMPQTLLLLRSRMQSFWGTSSTYCPEGFLKMRMRDYFMNVFHIFYIMVKPS